MDAEIASIVNQIEFVDTVNKHRDDIFLDIKKKLEATLKYRYCPDELQFLYFLARHRHMKRALETNQRIGVTKTGFVVIFLSSVSSCIYINHEQTFWTRSIQGQCGGFLNSNVKLRDLSESPVDAAFRQAMSTIATTDIITQCKRIGLSIAFGVLVGWWCVWRN
jgi:hypothetical protein